MIDPRNHPGPSMGSGPTEVWTLDRISTARRTQLLLLAAAGLAVVSMTGLGMSLAIFTDQATVNANAFTAGTVKITTDHPSTALVTYANMAPGDQVTTPLVVNNTGSLSPRYSISASALNGDGKGLKDQLVLTIKTGVTCTNAGFGAGGTTLYSGDLDSGVGGKIIGDAATGGDAGDRNLAPVTSETLCWNVRLPLNTPDAFQAATTTATFTFDAEQTANN